MINHSEIKRVIMRTVDPKKEFYYLYDNELKTILNKKSYILIIIINLLGSYPSIDLLYIRVFNNFIKMKLKQFKIISYITLVGRLL